MENGIKDLTTQNVISNEEIKNFIYTIRGKQVMLDSDVAMLYHYETKNINKAVKRNIERFPKEFCFQLTDEELKILRFQIGTSNDSINIIKLFIEMRKFLNSNGQVFERLTIV